MQHKQCFKWFLGIKMFFSLIYFFGFFLCFSSTYLSFSFVGNEYVIHLRWEKEASGLIYGLWSISVTRILEAFRSRCWGISENWWVRTGKSRWRMNDIVFQNLFHFSITRSHHCRSFNHFQIIIDISILCLQNNRSNWVVGVRSFIQPVFNKEINTWEKKLQKKHSTSTTLSKYYYKIS